MDASFLYAETASGPMHISAIYVLDGELPYERVLDHFASRIHLVPSYRRKLAQVPFNMGHPKWVDDPDFDLTNHVRSHELPEGSTLEEGIDAAVKLNEPMLDRRKPLWGFVVVSGVPDRTLILQMTHHSMIDGASGIDLTTILYDVEPDPAPIAIPNEPWEPEAPPNGVELFSEALSENIDALQSTGSASWWPDTAKQRELMSKAIRIGTSFVTRPVVTAPFNASIVGPRRRVRFMKQSFGEIREIRRALGGTINDVVLTVVTEAVARYLETHGEAIDGRHMRLMCPVNVRTEDQQGALGNQVSAIFPVLPAWPMPVQNRLAVVIAEIDRIKANEDAQAMALATEATSGAWPLAMAPTQFVGTMFDATRIGAMFPPPVLPGWRPPNLGINFVCTNVPGVQVPQYLAGHQVTDTIGLLVLTGNVGFSITILSYNKELFFSFICEPRLLPDLELITSNANDAFDELLAEARNRAAKISGGK
jgi:WS/DGAT/MGAT family acyltransferase